MRRHSLKAKQAGTATLALRRPRRWLIGVIEKPFIGACSPILETFTGKAKPYRYPAILNLRKNS
jgi:hypothetical protein